MISSLHRGDEIADKSPRGVQIPFDGQAERQAEGFELGEHHVAPLPLADVAIAEQPPVVTVAFGLGDEPRAGTHRVEILDQNLGIEAFLLLRMERMILEFRDDCFRKQFHNNRYLHCRNARPAKDRQARRTTIDKASCLGVSGAVPIFAGRKGGGTSGNKHNCPVTKKILQIINC